MALVSALHHNIDHDERVPVRLLATPCARPERRSVHGHTARAAGHGGPAGGRAVRRRAGARAPRPRDGRRLNSAPQGRARRLSLQHVLPPPCSLRRARRLPPVAHVLDRTQPGPARHRPRSGDDGAVRRPADPTLLFPADATELSRRSSSSSPRKGASLAVPATRTSPISSRRTPPCAASPSWARSAAAGPNSPRRGRGSTTFSCA